MSRVMVLRADLGEWQGTRETLFTVLSNHLRYYPEMADRDSFDLPTTASHREMIPIRITFEDSKPQDCPGEIPPPAAPSAPVERVTIVRSSSLNWAVRLDGEILQVFSSCQLSEAGEYADKIRKVLASYEIESDPEDDVIDSKAIEARVVLADWLKSTSKIETSTRDITRNGPRSIRSSVEVRNAAISALLDRGWLARKAGSRTSFDVLLPRAESDEEASCARAQDSVDVEIEAMSEVLRGWSEIDPKGKGITVSTLLLELETCPVRYTTLRGALMELCSPQGGKLNARTVGTRFRHFRDRVIGGQRLVARGKSEDGQTWAVTRADGQKSFDDIEAST